ncbi:MAG: hypothetical protein R6U20_02775 [Longimonas sp.]|uniref:hypothetical protein n=1 Tax=Longimonas sp. TaxID=2039626 RepID=UPI003975D995
MTDRELNDHLAALVRVTSEAHERLRGVQDALAVIKQTAARTLIEDPGNIDPGRVANQDVWRKEASLVSRRTTLLLWKAAALLNETASELRPTIETAPTSTADGDNGSETTMDGTVQTIDEASGEASDAKTEPSASNSPRASTQK